MKKVCLIIGAGAGIGGSVGAKFAANGYHAALCRRSDTEGLHRLVNSIKSKGGTASGHMLNAVEDGAIEKLVEKVEQIGPIEVVLFNLGAQIGNRSLENTALKTFELGWTICNWTNETLMATIHSLPPLQVKEVAKVPQIPSHGC